MASGTYPTNAPIPFADRPTPPSIRAVKTTSTDVTGEPSDWTTIVFSATTWAVAGTSRITSSLIVPTGLYDLTATVIFREEEESDYAEAEIIHHLATTNTDEVAANRTFELAPTFSDTVGATLDGQALVQDASDAFQLRIRADRASGGHTSRCLLAMLQATWVGAL